MYTAISRPFVATLILLGCLLLPANAQIDYSPKYPLFTAQVGDTARQSTGIYLTDNGVLPPNAYTMRVTEPTVPWLTHTATPSGFTMTPKIGNFGINVFPAGLLAGSYSTTLTIYSGSNPATSAIGTVYITFIISAPATLKLSPNPLSFPSTYYGGAIPPQTLTIQGTVASSGSGGQTLTPGSSSTINYSLFVDQPYFIPSKTSGSFPSGSSDQVSVTFNPAGLPPGSYTATIQATASNGLNTFTIAQASISAPTVTVTPRTIQLTAAPGASVNTSVLIQMTGLYQLAVEPAPGAPWLSASVAAIQPQTSPYNTTLTLTANAANQSTGAQLSAVVNIRSPQNLVVPQPINVTLNVTGGPTDLTRTPSSLSFSGKANESTASPLTQTVTVTNVGPAVAYSIQPSNSWIVVSKPTGSLPSNGSDTFNVSANPFGLPVGSASGTITISATGRPTQTVSVTCAVSSGTTPQTNLSVSQLNLNFSAVEGSAVTSPSSPQFIQVQNTGPAVSYTITPNQNTTWLQVSKSSGALAENGSDSFAITILPAGLSAGPYSVSVKVSAPSRPDQTITVNLQINPPTQPTTNLTALPANLPFSASPGSANSQPAFGLVTVTNTGPSVTYQVDSQNAWLQFSKFSATLPTDGSDTFQVFARATNLLEGNYQGSIRVSAPGRFTQVISVAFTVKKDSATTTLSLSPSQLTFFADPGQTPPPQFLTLAASDNSSQLVNATPTSSGNWLQVSSSSVQTPGTLGVSVNPNSTTRPLTGQLDLSPSSGSVASASVPITLRAIGTPYYTIPRIADGNFFITTITIVNLDTANATVSLSFFKEDTLGNTTPWFPSMENNASLNNVSIPVGASATWQTRGLGVVGENGWALVTTGQRISGFAVFRQTKPGERPQEAAVPINSGWQQRFLLPFDNIGNTTAVALSNVSAAEPSIITATFRDEAGAVIPGSYQRTLPPLGHIAFTLPADDRTYLANRRGTAEFLASGGRFSALGLRFSSTSSAITSFEPQSLNTISSGSLSIPQIADGVFPDGSASYTTSITVVNNDVTTARVSLRFYRQNLPDPSTQPWIPAMQNGAPLDNVDIKPGSSFTWRTTGFGPLAVGWAEVLTAQRVSGFAIFQQKVPGRSDQEAAVPINVGTQQRFLLPFDNTGNFDTTLALANTSATESILVSVIFRDNANNEILSDVISLPTRGHNAFSLSLRYGALKGRLGTGEFSAFGQLSALGLRYSETAFTSFRPQVK